MIQPARLARPGQPFFLLLPSSTRSLVVSDHLSLFLSFFLVVHDRNPNQKTPNQTTPKTNNTVEKEVSFMYKFPGTKIEEKRKRWEVDWKHSYDILPFLVDDPIVVGLEQVQKYIAYGNTKSLLVRRAVLWNWGAYQKELGIMTNNQEDAPLTVAAAQKADAPPPQRVDARMALGPDMEISNIKNGCCAAEYPTDFHVLILYPLRVDGAQLYAMTRGPNAAELRAAYDFKFGGSALPFSGQQAGASAAPAATHARSADDASDHVGHISEAQIKLEMQAIAPAPGAGAAGGGSAAADGGGGGAAPAPTPAVPQSPIPGPPLDTPPPQSPIPGPPPTSPPASANTGAAAPAPAPAVASAPPVVLDAADALLGPTVDVVRQSVPYAVAPMSVAPTPAPAPAPSQPVDAAAELGV